MKIERLRGIVVYLLNREIVNANALAEKFEVSTRTIQRDVETLNLAGIPITSMQGTNGGYGIIDSFKLDFSVSREGNNIDKYLKIIEEAIDKEKVIEFEYTNSYGEKTLRTSEPIGVIYKWYACEEYFKNASITTKENEDFILQFHVPNNEIGWKGLIFTTYGNKIKIIDTEELREEFMLKAEEIIDTYK